MTRLRPFWIVVAASAAALASWWLQADVRLDWSDEGFLWYGVWRVLAGEVPIRDFQSYDPGRYYWCAALSPLTGKGILGIRLAAALFQALALSLGLLALSRAARTRSALWTAGLVTLVWQFWFFRHFDSGYPLIAFFFAVRLIERPSPLRHLACGVFAGFSVWFGLNHALYVLAAFYSLSVYLEAKRAFSDGLRRRLAFAGGAAAGLAPLVGMMLAIPGFARAYGGHFDLLFGTLLRGATDIRALVRLPWNVPWNEIRAGEFYWTGVFHCVSWWFQGAALVTLVAVLGWALRRSIRLDASRVRGEAVLIAAVFVGAPYLHHVLARGDVTHLGEGMFPLVALALALDNRRLSRWIVLFTLVGALPLTNLFFKSFVAPAKMTLYRLGPDRLWIFKNDAHLADTYKRLVREHAPPGRPLFLAPIYATLYCVLEKPSPTHTIFFFKPGTEEQQRRTIDEIEKAGVDCAIVSDLAIDGREELRFSNAQRLVWNHLAAHFEAWPADGLPSEHYLLRRSLKAPR